MQSSHSHCNPKINVDALKSEVRVAAINQKANACPMVVRLAWHASGTFDKNDGSGGSNGATMRFEPETSDDANKGLNIIRDMLHPVKANHPEISHSDLWVAAGAAAVEFLGGPKVPFNFGRIDVSNDKSVPPNGRLPDAAQGAQHVRDVFYRMGFDDREIVCLMGAHTLGRCHLVRSGFDGPWTRNPLKFDNTFYKNLLHLEWQPRKWDGPFQYEDKLTGELMMLPTDMAMKTDPAFRKWTEVYANDEQKFFDDFAVVFSKLCALGCPASCDPSPKVTRTDSEKSELGAKFRELAMHGSVEPLEKLSSKVDVHEPEASSGRTALHKAAFWGHVDAIKYLTNDLKLDVNVIDYNGDTALHDAARFGHKEVVQILLDAGTDTSIVNKLDQDPAATAAAYGKTEIATLIANHPKPDAKL